VSRAQARYDNPKGSTSANIGRQGVHSSEARNNAGNPKTCCGTARSTTQGKSGRADRGSKKAAAVCGLF